MTVVYWAGLLVMGTAALTSMFVLNRSPRRAAQIATVETAGAVVALGVSVWREQWWQAVVWLVITCAALGNWWMCRRIDRLRKQLREIDEQDRA